MAGARAEFNDLLDSFQEDEFFADAMYPFSWIEEISTGIDRITGESSKEINLYKCQAFLINPSKSERPQLSIFKGLQAGDIAVLVQINELIKAPPLDVDVAFDSETYTCKEIVRDSVGVSWKILLRK